MSQDFTVFGALHLYIDFDPNYYSCRVTVSLN